MEKGQIITIYQQPISQSKIEGKATLVKCLNRQFDVTNVGTLEQWLVRFENEEQTYMRIILNTANVTADKTTFNNQK